MATELQSRDNVLLITAPTPDPRAGLILNTYLDVDRLIGFAQPTIWSDRGIEIARRALDSAHHALIYGRELADLSAAGRLQRALTAANDAVIDANHARSGNDHERRVGVGMGLCLRSGRTAMLALVPPVQAILFQGAGPVWNPRRESWVGDDPGLPGSPLGWAPEVSPTLVSTVIEHADEILLTTTAVAARLAERDELPNSAAAISDEIATLTYGVDPLEIVALSTRFEPATVSGNLRAITQQALGLVDRRARAVWTALRTPA